MTRRSSSISSSRASIDIAPLRKELVVLIDGERVGRIGIDRVGAICFLYDEGYDGIPLSVSMPDVPNLWDPAPQILAPGMRGSGRVPLRKSSPYLTRDLITGGMIPLEEAERPPRAYRERIVRPYLFGLLPDAKEQRISLGKRYGVKPDDALGLLHHIGFDLPGAVQLCPPDQVSKIRTMSRDYVPVTETEIARDLARIEGKGNPSWQVSGEHWSLAGNQPKRTYAYLDGKWYRCEGSAATTHIVKPGIVGMAHEALNEAVCLRLAKACGVPSVEASYRRFGNRTAIVVQRYDRLVDGGSVTRLHQEDLCQALSVMPEKKYASEEGPSAPAVMELLSRLPNAHENMLTFTAELFYNLLVLAPDAHAKNYSLLLVEDGVHLAPLYDCASGAAYKRPGGKPWPLAMGIGGTTSMEGVGARQIERYARTTGMNPEVCLNLMGNLALRVLLNFDAVFAAIRAEASTEIDAVDELRRKLEEPILRQAERLMGEALAALER